MNYIDHLRQRYLWKYNNKSKKISDTLYIDFDPYLFYIGDRSLVDKVFSEYEYEYCINPELRRIITWASGKILSALRVGIDAKSVQSVFVYIRIATSMLNTLVYKSKISHEAGIYFHDNLVRNTNILISELQMEDLPF